MSGTDEDEAHPNNRLLSEIDEEVRRRRSRGELLPSFEQHLDEAFERLTPGRSASEGAGAVELVEEAAHIDVEAPVASNLVVGEIPKRLVQRLTSWYLGYVAQQVTRFTWATTKALQSVDRRLSELERDARVRRNLLSALDTAGAAVDLGAWTTLVTEEMSGLGGRVLHADCGDGRLLRVLRDAGVDVYGVDPRALALDLAARVGVDVRLISSFEHLAELDEATLDGAVLSGSIDQLTIGSQHELIAESARVLRPRGILVLLCVNPDAWGRTVSVVEADLSPGRPLHAQTWVHLLEQRGFSGVAVQMAAPGGRLQPGPESGPALKAAEQAWDAGSSDLAKLNELLFPPPSFAVRAVRHG